MSSKPAHHHPIRGFRNPEGSPCHEATRADFYRFLWHGLSGRLNQVPTIPAGHVLTQAEMTESFAATKGNALQWLGHSAFRWKINNTVILSDPLLTDRASPFSWMGPKRFIPSPLVPEEAKADIILITHNHYDHLDLETLKRLPNKESVHVITPLHLSPLIKKAKISTITELDWHQSIVINRIKITLMPAIHFSSRWLHDRNHTLWGGYAVESEGLKLYLSGDTAYHPTVFKAIGKEYGPFTHALVAIGAYEPRKIMRASHVTPEEAVEIGKDVQGKILIGHHWGALALTIEAPFEPPIRFKSAATKAGYCEEDSWIMRIGETRPLD